MQKKLTCHFEKSLILKRNEVYFEAIGVVTEIDVISNQRVILMASILNSALKSSRTITISNTIQGIVNYVCSWKCPEVHNDAIPL